MRLLRKATILSVSFAFLVLHANAEGCDPGYFTTDTGCAKCPKGTYQNKVGADGCKPCAEGTVAVEEGSTSCTACPEMKMPTLRRDKCTCVLGALNKKDGSCEFCRPGTYFSSLSRGRQRACYKCEDMSVQPLAGKMECELCEDGTFANLERTKCISCPDGQVPLGKKRICGMCPAGRYYEPYNRRCPQCRPNKFKPAAGQGSCLPCPHNSHSVEGASECTRCEEGLTLLHDGTCGKCKVGQYFNYRRCLKCERDTFMPYESVATSCLVCAGHSFSGKGAAECTQCPLGEVLMKDGVCGACPPGQVYKSYSSKGCIDCSPGTFSRGGSATECTPCPSKSFSFRRAETCIACPRGQALLKSTRKCGTCPAGKYYASLKCFKCYDGSFNDSPTVTDNRVCTTCPDGTRSNEKRTACI